MFSLERCFVIVLLIYIYSPDTGVKSMTSNDLLKMSTELKLKADRESPLVDPIKMGNYWILTTVPQYEKYIIENKPEFAILLFKSNNCPPCRVLYQWFAILLEDVRYKKIVFFSTNLDDDRTIAKRFNGINSAPALVSFFKGKAITVLKNIPATEKDLKIFFDELLQCTDENTKNKLFL